MIVTMKSYAVAPIIFHFEVASVITQNCRLGTISGTEAESFLRDLETFDIRLAGEVTPLRDIMEMALRFGLSGYDAAYLALAQTSGLPIATTDERLIRAAKYSGVSLFKP